MSQLGYCLHQMLSNTHRESSFSTRTTCYKVLNLAAKKIKTECRQRIYLSCKHTLVK